MGGHTFLALQWRSGFSAPTNRSHMLPSFWVRVKTQASYFLRLFYQTTTRTVNFHILTEYASFAPEVDMSKTTHFMSWNFFKKFRGLPFSQRSSTRLSHRAVILYKTLANFSFHAPKARNQESIILWVGNLFMEIQGLPFSQRSY